MTRSPTDSGISKNTICLGLALLAGAFGPATPVRGTDIDEEPIRYAKSTPDNVISRLQQRIDAGKATLTRDDPCGYLRSLLKELKVPESSQTLVFSKTSLQHRRIGPRTPRALYFNDEVYVGYCQLGDVLEVSTVDPRLGIVFYLLDQKPADKPRFSRHTDSCLICHGSSLNDGFPGHIVRSLYTDAEGFGIFSSGSSRVDHRTPFKQRWGGWYVTGTSGKQTHLGNLIVHDKQKPELIDNTAGSNVTDLRDRFHTKSYLSGHSDLVALMVLEHQAGMHNLITRANFLTRRALYDEAVINQALGRPANYRSDSTVSRIKNAGDPLLKYLLFQGEARLAEPIQGTTPFAKEFPQNGPRDRRGRSLRDLELRGRLFQYPCSYLIYSPAFDALPELVKDHVLRRLWDVLTGKDQGADFAHLAAADRQAILEILVETKANLPEYWRAKGEK